MIGAVQAISTEISGVRWAWFRWAGRLNTPVYIEAISLADVADVADVTANFTDVL
jgi:hypothetical protein